MPLETTGLSVLGAQSGAYVPTTLYQSPGGFSWSTYHQSKIKIVGDSTANPVCGTRTALAATELWDIQVDATNLGGSATGLTLMVGVTAAAPTVPLYGPLTFPVAAAAGVTQFQHLNVGAPGIDADAVILHYTARVTGLIPGTTYTWQLTTAVSSSSSKDTLTNPVAFGKSAVSPDGNWYAATLQGTNQVQIIQLGGRPLWKLGPGYKANQLGQWNSVVKTALAVGASPVALAFSPDSTKLAVCNFTDGTVTFINVITNAVIGTSAVVHGAATNTVGVDWTLDSTTALVAVSDGSLNAVTAVASPVITNVATGLGALAQHGIRRVDPATTNKFWVCSTTVIYQGHMPTDTSWTQDSSFSPAGLTGVAAMCADNQGNLYAAVNGGTFAHQVIQVATGTTAVASSFTPSAGNTPTLLATTADGQELWVVVNLQAGAFETSDWGQTQSFLAASFYQPNGTSQAIQGLAESADGYLYVAATSTAGSLVYENPSATLSIAPGLPTGQGVLVTAVGGT